LDNADSTSDAATQSKPSSREKDNLLDQEPAVMQSTKGGYKGRRAKPKGRSKKEASKDAESIATNPMDIEEDADEDASAKPHEELKHKGEASSLFEDLAKQFASFHDKLFNEKLSALASEVEMLTQADCHHPEYMRQAACVDARYTKQVSEVHAYYRHKMQALRVTTLAERSQLHSQYFQTARELREEQAYQLGEDWYKIQKERRQSSQGQDGQYILKFPTKRSAQLRNQAKYNQEVSILSGVAKYVGFPAAPAITGAEGDALEDDLKMMKVWFDWTCCAIVSHHQLTQDISDCETCTTNHKSQQHIEHVSSESLHATTKRTISTRTIHRGECLGSASGHDPESRNSQPYPHARLGGSW
jgi:hypothetical protein